MQSAIAAASAGADRLALTSAKGSGAGGRLISAPPSPMWRPRRRVSCPERGVVVCVVPWARHDARFTRAFEDQVAWLAVNTSKSAVAELMRVSWRSVGRICERVAEKAGRDLDLLAGLERIGIDEISHRKGQRYPLSASASEQIWYQRRYHEPQTEVTPSSHQWRKPASEAGLRVIGAAGFEPATARPPAECATRLRHAPWPTCILPDWRQTVRPRGGSSTVEPRPSKAMMRVRFPSAASSFHRQPRAQGTIRERAPAALTAAESVSIS